MHRRSLLATLAGGSALAGCVNPLRGGASTAAGMTIDTLDVPGSPGDEVPVARADRVTLLDFFATWCAPCKPQMDHLRTIRERFQDVHMLSITWERAADAVAAFWRTHDGTWPVAHDPELRTGEQYDIRAIPTLVVLDASGAETWRHVGLASTERIASELAAAKR